MKLKPATKIQPVFTRRCFTSLVDTAYGLPALGLTFKSKNDVTAIPVLLFFIARGEAVYSVYYGIEAGYRREKYLYNTSYNT
jgi:hypothetical protein